MNALRGAWGAAIALVALTAACDSMTEAGVPPGAVELHMQPVPDEVAQYLYSGVSNRRRVVIEDVASWTALWQQVTQWRIPQPPIPEIDFANDAVVVAAMGTRGSGGHTITIEGVYEAAGQLYVVVREVSPGSNCLTTAALTAPVHAVRIPRRNLPVQFVEHTELRNCP